MKASFPMVVVIIMFVFGIIGIALIFYWATGLYSNMVHGQCWGSIETTMSKLKSDLQSFTVGQSAVTKITVGECIGGVIIFNKNDNGNYQGDPKLASFDPIIKEKCPCITKDKCPNFDGYKSYILILPWKTMKEEFQQQQTFWENVKDKTTVKYYADLYKEGEQYVKFLSPTCIGVEGSFQDTYFLPPSLSDPNTKMNEKDTPLCYEISKVAGGSQGTFGFRLNNVPDSRCP